MHGMSKLNSPLRIFSESFSAQSLTILSCSQMGKWAGKGGHGNGRPGNRSYHPVAGQGDIVPTGQRGHPRLSVVDWFVQSHCWSAAELLYTGSLSCINSLDPSESMGGGRVSFSFHVTCRLSARCFSYEVLGSDDIIPGLNRGNSNECMEELRHTILPGVP